jgi:hypothetical protein
MPPTESTSNGETQAKPAAEKPKLTGEQKKSLFTAYDEASENVEAAQVELDAAKKLQGKAAKAIVDAMGPGPFTWRNERITFAKAKNSETYYARGKHSKEAETIG